MAIYMKFGGISNLFNGDVTEENHKKWIELSSLAFGCTRSIAGTAAGAARGREASLCSLSEIKVSKPADSASQDLMREAMIGAIPGSNVSIHLVTTGRGNQAETFAVFDLEQCMISGFGFGSGGDRPLEELTLNFTKITYSMAQGDSDGALLAPRIGYFDVATSKGG